MIEVRSYTHTIRMFADGFSHLDIFRAILYTGYQGDPAKIPWYYFVSNGHSCVTDLTESMDEILSKMKSTTRNEIRRGIREGCEFAITDDVDGFISFYNSFCKSKGLQDYIGYSRISKYKNLVITKVHRGGEILAMHANLLDELSKTALLVYSCSQRLDVGADKKLIGWANRFLHYKDLEWLKTQGFNQYDWSGVCVDKADPRYSIGQFKLSFGGILIDSISARTPLYVFLEKIQAIARVLRCIIRV